MGFSFKKTFNKVKRGVKKHGSAIVNPTSGLIKKATGMKYSDQLKIGAGIGSAALGYRAMGGKMLPGPGIPGSVAGGPGVPGSECGS